MPGRRLRVGGGSGVLGGRSRDYLGLVGRRLGRVSFCHASAGILGFEIPYAAEVTPVGEIDGQTFTVGEITQELMTAYSDLVRNHQKASASAA